MGAGRAPTSPRRARCWGIVLPPRSRKAFRDSCDGTRRVMDARPDHLVKNARDRLDAGDAYGAIHLLKELVEKGQAFADAYNLLGLALAMVGQKDEGLAAFDKALALNPRYVDARLNRAVTLSDLGRSDEAAKAFTDAQSLGAVDHTGYSAPAASQLANLHAELAEAYLEAGGRDEAIRELEQAARPRPEFVALRSRPAPPSLPPGPVAPAPGEAAARAAPR